MAEVGKISVLSSAERAEESSKLRETLDRLSDKDLVTSSVDRLEGTVGRPRRIYRVAPLGLEALRETHQVRASMWDGLSSVLTGSSVS